MIKLLYYYVTLLGNFDEQKTDNSIRTTRRDLSDIFECSGRNVIHLLNKMEEEGWILREKGNGRGNKTRISFLKTIEEILLDNVQKAISNEESVNLFRLLEKYYWLGENAQGIMVLLFGLNNSDGIQGDSNEESLTFPYFRKLFSLDPIQVKRQTESHLIREIFNTLVIYNAKASQYSPNIAHYWERDSLGCNWTFYLRKGVFFHHGKELTSKDIKFTFERMKGTDFDWIFQSIKSIQCVTDYMIRFTLSKPQFMWLSILSSFKCAIVPFNYGGKSAKEFQLKPIGTGPFRVDRHEDDYLMLKAHTSYFEARAHLDRINILFLPTMEKYFTYHQSTENTADYLPFHLMDSAESNYESFEKRNLSIKYLLWNVTKTELDKEERKKVEEVIDKSLLVKDLGYPRQETVGFLMGNVETNVPIKTGLNSGSVELTILAHDLKPDVDDLYYIKERCEQNGIQIKLVIVPFEDFSKDKYVQKADLILSEYVLAENDEMGLLSLFMSKENTLDKVLPDNYRKEVNVLLEKIWSEKEEEQRRKFFIAIENILLHNHLVFPLYSTYQRGFFNQNLLGVNITNHGLVSFKELFFRRN
ncbi:MarR-like DNA-binding transcriptional regulator SgrR of sgrS sRNA [Salirhabdus euzebyi]|uniref:MarR-like DNA-binding transcriptional regulator SgrR of sgrS sRNA n=1 Tax=Salirhabdus euzebyi TaxID=394506 RepID=A0A841Q8B5_9BACI|nr:ABC transporter substrate-binding protein [Salirhabdus euzebyi]MBB6454625.1 MarR-like DNA-binding transcriptional regulator SgrR of sgrS sRNA [Salirhabdus euzebyi]